MDRFFFGDPCNPWHCRARPWKRLTEALADRVERWDAVRDWGWRCEKRPVAAFCTQRLPMLDRVIVIEKMERAAHG